MTLNWKFSFGTRGITPNANCWFVRPSTILITRLWFIFSPCHGARRTRLTSLIYYPISFSSLGINSVSRRTQKDFLTLQTYFFRVEGSERRKKRKSLSQRIIRLKPSEGRKKSFQQVSSFLPKLPESQYFHSSPARFYVRFSHPNRQKGKKIFTFVFVIGFLVKIVFFFFFCYLFRWSGKFLFRLLWMTLSVLIFCPQHFSLHLSPASRSNNK